MSIFLFRESEHSQTEITQSLSLIRESFGNIDIATRDYYNWQYLRNPAGNANLIMAYHNEEAAGQIASIPCRYKLKTEEIIIPLTLNLCVVPKFRGRGLMSQLISNMHKYLEARARFSIGVPNEASIAGHLRNGYLALSIPLLVKPIRPSLYFGNRILNSSLKPFDYLWSTKSHDDRVTLNNGIFDHRFDKYEQEHSKNKTLIQVRNSNYLNWRYLENPTRKYVPLVYYADNDDLLGYLIVRTSQVRGKNIGIIADLAAMSEEIGKKLVLRALEYFWDEKIAIAICSGFSGKSEFLALKGAGFFALPDRFRPHPLALCIKLFGKDMSLDNMVSDRRSWFFMLGDNDAL